MQTVTIDQLSDVLDEGGVVIDVREREEYATAHVPGARSIPMGQVASRKTEIDRERPVYLICDSGNRSSAMVDLLAAEGYDAHNVRGGTRAWIESGRPVEGGA
ncbi:rhodanese-like domain-containing protein [Nocardioides coralli]|uniref:rhodanese-like domain-containing protein n=1 Tax=Nocardioides coralli TaxID=2872154 RepID=UPI001CA3AD48|nr:rhodanese-like domain-containing protein [Nocardioides coralli]QZY29622.1 rhodanese-like domain-containing protein [Nocardioides coralli]